MNKISNIVDYSLIILGTSYSLQNIESLLGIIILSIQIIWLLFKFVVKLINVLKNKQSLDTLDNDVKDLIHKIEEITTKEGENDE